jgi:thiamine biosynthesis lipoprotein
MSDYRETSELMALCQQAGGPPVSVSEDLFRILSRSQELARLTGGAFDVTVGPVARLWRRARRTGELPDPQRLARARELVGDDKLHLDEKTRSVRLEKSGMLLDLGGIAKGYAADEAISVLQRHGIRRALVAAGGDLVASDPPPGASGWAVAIASLAATEEAPARHLSLRRMAVSTSGDAEQYVEIHGVRYSHIVDPRTGLGVTGRTSVTVVARNGTTSDALATAASVLGPERGLELINSLSGVAALFGQASGPGSSIFASRRWSSVPRVRPREAREVKAGRPVRGPS